MKTLIGIDFSMCKPAACVYFENQYYFYSWPKDLSDKIKNLYINTGVNISERTPTVILKDIMQTEIYNASNLSNDIIKSLQPFLNKDTIIAFEGLSYGSTGNSILSLAGWRYIFQNDLSEYVSLENMFTYSPITIKSIAGCAKKGMGKPEMINAFIKSGINCKFCFTLSSDPAQFKKKGGKTWIDHLDDLVDAYWTIHTLNKKENLGILL